jgi:hypothetical protein
MAARRRQPSSVRRPGLATWLDMARQRCRHPPLDHCWNHCWCRATSGPTQSLPSIRQCLGASLEAVEDQIQPELELFRVVVSGLHGVFDDHLGEMRVLVGGKLPEDVLPDLRDLLRSCSGMLIC